MNMLMFYMSIISSLLFLFSTNPFSMGIILILQTLFLSLFLGPIMKSFWFFYLLILIFIGGMLVLFLYVTTIFPNEKFSFNQNKIIFMMMFMIMIILTIYIFTSFKIFSLNKMSLFINPYMMENFFVKPSMKMFVSNSNIMLILMVNYLFYCMIVIIKIVNLFKGPLRKMNYV